MKIFNKISIIFLLLISSFYFGTSVAFSYSITYQGGFNPVPTGIYMHRDFMSASKTATSNACSQWNNAGAGSLITRGVDHSNQICPNSNWLNQVTKANMGTNNYLMITYSTQTTTIGGVSYLKEADINVNTSYPWGNDGSSNNYDFGACITHEIGHLLGLGHSSTSGATMKSGLVKGDIAPRSIELDDKNGINSIY